MSHPIHRVVSFEVIAAHTIRVAFDDGSQQAIDFEPVLRGALYAPLLDPVVFRGVRLDPIAHTLVWPNGADFDPAILHDWPSRAAAMHDLARQWREPARR